MNLHLVDWSIVAALMIVLLIAAWRTRRYTRTVAAFLAADRAGGRYLISVADGISMVGVISLVWFFEQNDKVGFTGYWWGLMEGPAMIIMALSGWVIYRYRQTRAMTLAQFLEMRYSRNFRIFAGLVAFISGIINFGIFPAVGARFFIAMCGFPDHYEFLSFELATFPSLMVVLLAVALLFVFLGGQIAVMVTDFLQGTFANIAFVIIIAWLLLTFPWENVGAVLLDAPAGESKVNPLDLGQESHFDFWYFAIGVVVFFYGKLCWQGTQGYQCAVRNPHEAKMAGILGGWRMRVLMLIVLVLPICVRTFLHHPAYEMEAAIVHEQLAALDSDTLRHQLRAPYAVGAMFPPGLLGLMCAAMVAAFLSTHDTYLHSWGSILVQDVILPFRRKPLSPRQHIWLLRGAIVGIAVFIFFFSLYYRPTQYISMFLALTGAVFVGGAGSAVIGGLYWKRGTTAAAWAAMIMGMSLASAGIILKQIDTDVMVAAPMLVQKLNSLTGQELMFYAIAASVITYVLVSLLGPRTIFNMDRLLHRGKYAIADDPSTNFKDAKTIMEKLGFSREFTGRDKVVTYITLSWPLAWTVIFIAGTTYALLADVPDITWLRFWHGYTWFILAGAVVITIWFAIGGTLDLRYLFRTLRTHAQDTTDDGRVEHRADDVTPLDQEPTHDD